MRAIMIVATLGLAATMSVAARAEASDHRPGEGILCAYMYDRYVADIGRQCFPERDAALQAELDNSVHRLEVYIFENSDMTRYDLETMYEGAVGAKDINFCQNESGFYEAFASAGIARIRMNTDRLVSRPGKPTLGHCP